MKRKKLLFAGLAAGVGALTGTNAEAQTITAFTPGDVVVYRVGTGGATALTNAGTAVFLDEYNPMTGNLDGTEALSTLATPLVASGTAGSEGLLNLSTNGQYLLATGYDAAVGTTNTGSTSIAGTTSATVPREVATINSTGTVVQTTINNYSGNNIRSAASPDGTTIYTSGANTGVLSVTSGGSNVTGTVISSTSTNLRSIGIYGGQLYVGSGSTAGGNLRIASVGTGLPTTAGQTAAEVPGITVGSTTTGAYTPVSGPYGFVGATLTPGGTSIDTFYIADNNTGAIDKYSLSGTSFTLNGTAALAGVTGLTAEAVGTGELLVATTAAGIFTLTDTTGAGGTLAGTPTQIAVAGTNEAFRGDAFAPTAVPEPSTWAAMVAGMLGLFSVLRLRRSKTVGA